MLSCLSTPGGAMAECVGGLCDARGRSLACPVGAVEAHPPSPYTAAAGGWVGAGDGAPGARQRRALPSLRPAPAGAPAPPSPTDGVHRRWRGGGKGGDRVGARAARSPRFCRRGAPPKAPQCSCPPPALRAPPRSPLFPLPVGQPWSPPPPPPRVHYRQGGGSMTCCWSRCGGGVCPYAVLAPASGGKRTYPYAKPAMAIEGGGTRDGH